MASTDFTELTGSLSSGSLDRGVTGGIPRPSGGGGFIYGFNSLDVSAGSAGLFVNGVGFAPMAKGGSVRGAIQRGLSGGPTNFSPLLFLGLQGSTVGDNGYLLGLADEEPHHIVLRKGSFGGGIPAGAPGALGVLARSTGTFSAGMWLHLRLDMIVNVNGDVVLNAFQNDLGANPVTAPIWAAIQGLGQFIDDVLQVNSGSAPYTTGRGGFGFVTKDVTRRGYFDQFELLRQT